MDLCAILLVWVSYHDAVLAGYLTHFPGVSEFQIWWLRGSESREKMKGRIKNSTKGSLTHFQINCRQNRKLNDRPIYLPLSDSDEIRTTLGFLGQILFPVQAGRQRGQGQLLRGPLLQWPGSEHTGHPGKLGVLAMIL